MCSSNTECVLLLNQMSINHQIKCTFVQLIVVYNVKCVRIKIVAALTFKFCYRLEKILNRRKTAAVG